MNRPRFIVVTAIILAAAASRLIPHPPNVAPITALALFSGAQFADKRLAFVIPIVALLLSDLVIGFYSQIWIVYGTFCLIACIGFLLRSRKSFIALATATLTSSLLFFVVTNLGVWVFGSLYPKTIAGLTTCFIVAIPFFQNTLLGDGFYTTLLFSVLWMMELKWPAISAARPESHQTIR